VQPVEGWRETELPSQTTLRLFTAVTKFQTDPRTSRPNVFERLRS
jgi:hypothetical protein